ncbi:MAG: hypothetical protein QOG57_255, partial [Pseudonocardiales bacterium]|nr:hypothetical protein [Pseudonocardiales bacterium]
AAEAGALAVLPVLVSFAVSLAVVAMVDVLIRIPPTLHGPRIV